MAEMASNVGEGGGAGREFGYFMHDGNSLWFVMLEDKGRIHPEENISL